MLSRFSLHSQSGDSSAIVNSYNRSRIRLLCSKTIQMFIRAIAFLLFLATVALAQQPTPILPEPKLTPGDSFPVTVQDLCVPGYTKKVRNVPAVMKREVYAEYRVTSHASGDYEVYHLIPLELGGSSSIKNLWPESLRTSPWSAQAKDQLERKLHKLVCSGQLDLKTAQQAVAADWIGAYKFYVSPDIGPARGFLRLVSCSRV